MAQEAGDAPVLGGMDSVVVESFAGDGEAGWVDASLRASRFDAPWGLALGPDGSLYVADSGNHVVRRIWVGEVA